MAWVGGPGVWRSGQSGVRGRSGLYHLALYWPAMQARPADLLSPNLGAPGIRRVHADQRPTTCQGAQKEPRVAGHESKI